MINIFSPNIRTFGQKLNRQSVTKQATIKYSQTGHIGMAGPGINERFMTPYVRVSTGAFSYTRTIRSINSCIMNRSFDTDFRQ